MPSAAFTFVTTALVAGSIFTRSASAVCTQTAPSPAAIEDSGDRSLASIGIVAITLPLRGSIRRMLGWAPHEPAQREPKPTSIARQTAPGTATDPCSAPVLASSRRMPSPTPAAHVAPPAIASQSGSPRSPMRDAPAASMSVAAGGGASGTAVVVGSWVVAGAVLVAPATAELDAVPELPLDPPQAASAQPIATTATETTGTRNTTSSGRDESTDGMNRVPGIPACHGRGQAGIGQISAGAGRGRGAGASSPSRACS